MIPRYSYSNKPENSRSLLSARVSSPRATEPDFGDIFDEHAATIRPGLLRDLRDSGVQLSEALRISAISIDSSS